ncbi:hypothetical protein MRB53_011480 [Persea americana]|uniref:Uncharacterized protein n=1 Tax=Persea americana TaxID=3435 RepID=A0ACC2LVG7_PERAE|nr:hypothetical protein MRB53_011480 [Persea americana]
MKSSTGIPCNLLLLHRSLKQLRSIVPSNELSQVNSFKLLHLISLKNLAGNRGAFNFSSVMGFCLSPLQTPTRLLWSTSFFRHKPMLF